MAGLSQSSSGERLAGWPTSQVKVEGAGRTAGPASTRHARHFAGRASCALEIANA
jgi:hypothetical protein